MNRQSEVSPAQAYHDFLGPAIFRPWAAVLLAIAAPREGERVLDLACGTGIVAEEAAPSVGPQGRVIGVDSNPDMLAVARQNGRGSVDYVEASADELPFPDGSFDLVVCQQGLQFFKQKEQAIREMRRTLAAGGRAVVAVWQGLDQHPVFRAIFEAEARQLGAEVERLARPFSFGSGDALRTLLRGGGFQSVELTVETRDVTFNDPDRFLRMSVLAGAAVIPELAEADDQQREEILTGVAREAEPIIDRYRTGVGLTFPMTANLAQAR
jgi:SAM-dependent methyltransferase